MSALSRFAPSMARSAIYYHPRHMATASASDPVQRIFVDKIKEFKSSSKGLDEAHEKAMKEEMLRLRRVYKVDDEKKLSHLEYKFSSEANVSLRDLDESKELRSQLASGEYQKRLTAAPKQVSTLIASIPEQVTLDLHLPPLNKPDPVILLDNEGVPRPTTIGEMQPDYDFVGDKMTPEKLEKDLLVKFGPAMPTVDDDKSPQRDVVNFPRIPQPLTQPPTRYHMIPECWFQFFYPKTGLSGPYAFAGAFTTFLLSKEWVVWEHELLTGVSSTVIFTYAVIKYGPMIMKYCKAKVQEECDDWEAWRLGNIDLLEKVKVHYGNELKKTDLIDEMYKAREQDIELQLEGEYRSRLQTIYNDTRRRLNYLVAVADSQRQIAHKNMVNWVISNAVSSIGQKQEAEVLDNCITNLRLLASKNPNAI